MRTRLQAESPTPLPVGEELQQILYPYGIGIDTHSRFIQVCVLKVSPGVRDSKNVTRTEAEFRTDWRSLKRAHEWALRQVPDVTDPAQLRYCIESTATYHLPVLKAWGGIPCVVNPLLAGPTRRKTDVLDARLLAHHSITGVWKPSFVPAEQAQVLRVLWAARREAVRRATRASNRLNNIVLRFGHTFGADCSMRSAEGEGILSDLVEGVTPCVPGVAPDGLPPAIRPLISALLADMKSAVSETNRATTTADNFVRARDWPTGKGDIPGTNLLALLRSVPGVGQTTALTWLAEITDPRRFDHAKQVAAYAGCDPSLKVSAGKVTSHTRRAGNLRLHQALLYAASGLLRQPHTPLGMWGKSIAGRHKKGGHRKACGAVARRLACALWHVHRKAEPFSYAAYRLSQKLVVPSTPLDGFLKPRAVTLLAAEGIQTSADLADAYADGKLATIFGLGQKTLDAVREWVIRWGKTVHNPRRPHGPARSGKTPPGQSYVLNSALTFQPKRTQPKQRSVQQVGRRSSKKGK